MQEMNILQKLEKIGLSMIFEFIPGKACVSTDPSCTEIIYNSAAAQFLEMASCTGLFLAGARPPYKIFRRGRELAPAELPLQRAAWLGEEILGDELEVVCLNGLKKHTLWNARPLRDHQRNIIAALCTFEDITDKKRLAEEVRCNEKKYRLLLNNIPGLVFWSNKAGQIEFANESAGKFFRPWLGNPQNRPLLDIVTPTVDQPGIHEYRLPNGQQVWIQWMFRKYAHPVTQASGLLSVGFDITSLYRTNQAISLDYELRYRTDLFNKALRGELNRQELREIACRSGIVFPDSSLLHIIRIREVADERQPEVRREQYQARLDRLIFDISRRTSGIAWQSADGIIILIPVPHAKASLNGSPADETAEILLALTRKAFPDNKVLIGIGGLTGNPPDLIPAYQQAVFALRAGLVTEQGKPFYRWQDLGILQLMASCCDSELTHTFIQTELGALLAYDKIRASSLVDTLEQILTAGSVAAITRQLHIHEKTVLFRKRKIEQVLGTSIDNYAKKLNLLMAIRLLRLHSGANSEYQHK
ncbi:helix-turn-helix domain-containing protein|uniref:PAS fold-containing protein n=1 Tax=Dendrosporobacter quercicolus TaxID=146817 RepID=A0A1H0AT33_9FIRM|nr:PAS domain-containing protein [Dendrosporobacter quercicolus]NSL48729.1 helix-turn-helix domain-containing protein [Dendrosporobacter quercicolus DSM 1736]SDN36479.1 PAS fold-containing protein [Dendrosporobacter quercicolus]